MHWLPKIQSYQFPHHVQGVGQLTPLRLVVSGWGVLQVRALHRAEFVGYRKLLTAKAHALELNVPKGQRIQVRLWNLFGWSTAWIDTPTNNTPVAALQVTRPVSKAMPSPGFTLPTLAQPLKALQLLRAPWRTLTLHARSTGKKMSTTIMCTQTKVHVPEVRHVDGYQYNTPRFKSTLHKGAFTAPQQNFDLRKRKLP